MFCKKCGSENGENVKFCGKCGVKTSDAILKEENTTTDTIDKLSELDNSIIKCGNCGYVGRGEKARSITVQALAWLCIFFAPLITLIYFIATHKWKCPKCQSTFLGVKNKEGTFVGQKGGNKGVLIFVWIIVGIAIIGILSSVVLASLNTAREKAQQATERSIN